MCVSTEVAPGQKVVLACQERAREVYSGTEVRYDRARARARKRGRVFNGATPRIEGAGNNDS